MATRDGRKTPTGSEIDDWFDLLDEESPEPGPKAPPPPTEISRKITPAVDPVDSWDWDMEAPSRSVPPPIAAEPEEEEFTDFGGPTPVAGPIGAVSVSSPPKPETTRRFQGTMMFGATPLPPPSTAPPAPVSERPAPVAPPPPLPVSTPPKPPSQRQRTPVPRAPVVRANQVVPLPGPSSWVPPPAPPVPSHHPELTSADLDDLEFEDVSTSRHSVPRVERRSEQATQQRSTPVVPVTEVQRTQHTPVVEASIPPEAQRSPVPSRPSAQQQRSLTPPSTRREMIDRFELGDFTGALSLAETLLEIDRTDPEARRIAETSRTRLRAIYVGRLGALDQVPVMMIPHAELRWLALDHRAGFVLSLVDGTSSIEEIIDVSTMPQLEVLRTLYNLLSQNVISLRRPRY
ncbi:MAG: hypothetical protein IPN17_01045 [Deltaproteobacteria bacterium]|nr:hypothetical protein [Deltaproteobacteria bacterium]